MRITDIYDPDLKPEPSLRRLDADDAADQHPQPQQSDASASFSPRSGPVCRYYTLSVSGFGPNRTLSIALAARRRQRELLDDEESDGTGAYTFGAGPQCAGDVQGTYTATVRDAQTGDTAQASVTVSGGGSSGGVERRRQRKRRQRAAVRPAALAARVRAVRRGRHAVADLAVVKDLMTALLSPARLVDVTS